MFASIWNALMRMSSMQRTQHVLQYDLEAVLV